MLRPLLHRIVAQPAVYDTVQRLAGYKVTLRRLQPVLAETADQSVLDVGAGTGLYVAALPASARYLWLDNDTDKLRGFQARTGRKVALIGDGTQIGLRDKSVDYAICIAVMHHLDALQFQQLLAELARVVRKRLFLLDALATDAWTSTLLWRYDRGSTPHTAQQLTDAVATYFDIEQSDSYAIYHRYLLLTARPK